MIGDSESAFLGSVSKSEMEGILIWQAPKTNLKSKSPKTFNVKIMENRNIDKITEVKL